jgi:hypothetical protein
MSLINLDVALAKGVPFSDTIAVSDVVTEAPAELKLKPVTFPLPS